MQVRSAGRVVQEQNHQSESLPDPTCIFLMDKPKHAREWVQKTRLFGAATNPKHTALTVKKKSRNQDRTSHEECALLISFTEKRANRLVEHSMQIVPNFISLCIDGLQKRGGKEMNKRAVDSTKQACEVGCMSKGSEQRCVQHSGVSVT